MIYETQRLLLKVPEIEEAELIYNYFIKNKEFLKTKEPRKIKDFFSIETQQEIIKMQRKGIERGKEYKLWIYLKNNPDFVIGYCGLSNIIRGAFNSCFLGYRLDKDYINYGYMTEAIEKIVEIAFTQLNLHRIEANIMPENIASIRVVEKCGFIYEGRSRKYLKIDGKWRDHIHMVILKEDENFQQKKCK